MTCEGSCYATETKYGNYYFFHRDETTRMIFPVVNPQKTISEKCRQPWKFLKCMLNLAIVKIPGGSYGVECI